MLILWFVAFLAILAIIAFNPITWIIVATVLIIRDNKKSKIANADRIDQNVSRAHRIKPQSSPIDSITKWNWLLYIGSFLIILAMFYFVSSVNENYVAPFTIALTLIIYTTGIVLFQSIKYLRPVGKAFVYSSLCMIPTWSIALISIGISERAVPLCVTIAFLIASFVGAILLSDKIIAHIALLSIAPFIWSFAPLLELNSIGASYYFTYLSFMIASLIPMFFAINEQIRLPEAFRVAANSIGKALLPATYIVSLFLLFKPDIYSTAPFLRFICAIFFLIYSLAFWLHTKKYSYGVTLRFAIQGVILSLMLDTLGVSLVSNFFVDNNTVAILTCASVWLLTFTAQIVIALFVPKVDDTQKRLEYAVSIASIACIFLTPAFCQNLSTATYATVWLMVCLVIAILGIIHAIHYKNVLWGIATDISIMVTPVIIGAYIATPSWDSKAYLVAYTIVSLLFLVSYYLLRKIQEKESHIIGIATISVSCLAICYAAHAADLGYIGYLLTACHLALFAVLSNVKVFYEAALYSFGLCAIAFFDTLLFKNINYASYGDYSYLSNLRNIIDAHIIGITLLAAQFISSYSYHSKNKIRFIVGFSLFSIIMTSSTISGYIGGEYLWWALLFLVEQVAALIYAVIRKENWLIWFSSIEILLIAFDLTSDMAYLWLAIIGISLIAIVIWQLRKANAKMLNDASKEKELPKQQ